MEEAGVDGALIVQPINHMYDHSLITRFVPYFHKDSNHSLTFNFVYAKPQAWYFLVNAAVYIFPSSLICLHLCIYLTIFLLYVVVFWKGIHPNSLVVALQILQKMEVELSSLKILSSRSLIAPIHVIITTISTFYWNSCFFSDRMAIELFGLTHTCGPLVRRYSKMFHIHEKCLLCFALSWQSNS